MYTVFKEPDCKENDKWRSQQWLYYLLQDIIRTKKLSLSFLLFDASDFRQWVVL